MGNRGHGRKGVTVAGVSKYGEQHIDKVLDFCRSCVSDSVEIQVTDEMSLGEGETRQENGKIVMYLGVKRFSVSPFWSQRELLEFCVAAGHELRHLEQRGVAMFSDMSTARPADRDVCVSYWACARNRRWYESWNAKTALCEVDAEYCGLVYGEYMANAYCGISDTEKAIVKYCNKQVRAGVQAEAKCRNASERCTAGYYLKPGDCRSGSLRSWDDIDDAFEQAEARAKAYRFLYKARYGRDDTYPFGDEFFDIMRRGRTAGDDCFDKFIKANRIFDDPGSYDLVDAMACLALYLHPEDIASSPVDLSDLTAENVFGSPFSETPAEMLAYRDYVFKHGIDIVNMGKPLDRYSEGSVKRQISHGEMVKLENQSKSAGLSEEQKKVAQKRLPHDAKAKSRGDRAMMRFDAVMQQVEAQDLSTEREKRKSSKDKEFEP